MKQRDWLAPLLLILATLACSGTPASMQILDQPVYVCPTATPHLSDTPNPPPTPFIMRPPQEFFVGDAVYTGGFVSSVSVRLRLFDISTLPASPTATGSPRNIVRWILEIKNVGRVAYEVFPAWQMYVSTVVTPTAEVDGVWGASRDAVMEVGLNSLLEAVTLAPAETRTFTLASYIPAGVPRRFTYALDPTERPTPVTPGVPGSNLMVWTNTTNTICAGDLAEPPLLPTPVR